MIVKIENLDIVLYRLADLERYYFHSSNDYATILEVCHDTTGGEFYNISHRAIKEVKYLAINKNDNVLNSYYKRFKYCFDKFENWKKNILKEPYMITQIDISLVLISDVFHEIKEYIPHHENKTSQIDHDNNKTDETKTFSFKNNFDKIDPKVVYSHFKTGLVDNNYIDLKTLKEFLKQAFEDFDKKDKPKKKIRMENTTNSMKYIIEVFHKYYSKQVSKHGKKTKYVKLLTDNFIDFDYQKTHDNFRS